MRKHLVAGACCLTLIVGTVMAAETVKSGPQVGDKLAGPFHPLNINGDKAGEKNCLYCSNGDHPVAMVFAREVSEPLTKLIKKIDAATVKNNGAKMGSFVVFCNDDEKLADQLKELAKTSELKETILAIDNSAGPKGYKVSKDADVTVVLYVERTVKANYSFKKGDLTEKDVEKVLEDVSKIIPAK